MTRKLQQWIRECIESFKRMKAWKRAVTIFACVATFIVTYALILPAITAGNNSCTLKAETREEGSGWRDVTGTAASPVDISPGSEIRYTITVVNSGTDAKTYQVTGNVPDHARLVKEDGNKGMYGGNNNAGEVVATWNATIGPGETETFSYIVKLESGPYNNAPITISNDAEVQNALGGSTAPTTKSNKVYNTSGKPGHLLTINSDFITEGYQAVGYSTEQLAKIPIEFELKLTDEEDKPLKYLADLEMPEGALVEGSVIRFTLMHEDGGITIPGIPDGAKVELKQKLPDYLKDYTGLIGFCKITGANEQQFTSTFTATITQDTQMNVENLLASNAFVSPALPGDEVPTEADGIKRFFFSHSGDDDYLGTGNYNNRSGNLVLPNGVDCGDKVAYGGGVPIGSSVTMQSVWPNGNGINNHGVYESGASPEKVIPAEGFRFAFVGEYQRSSEYRYNFALMSAGMTSPEVMEPEKTGTYGYATNSSSTAGTYSYTLSYYYPNGEPYNFSSDSSFTFMKASEMSGNQTVSHPGPDILDFDKSSPNYVSGDIKDQDYLVTWPYPSVAADGWVDSDSTDWIPYDLGYMIDWVDRSFLPDVDYPFEDFFSDSAVMYNAHGNYQERQPRVNYANTLFVNDIATGNLIEEYYTTRWKEEAVGFRPKTEYPRWHTVENAIARPRDTGWFIDSVNGNEIRITFKDVKTNEKGQLISEEIIYPAEDYTDTITKYWPSSQGGTEVLESKVEKPDQILKKDPSYFEASLRLPEDIQVFTSLANGSTAIATYGSNHTDISHYGFPLGDNTKVRVYDGILDNGYSGSNAAVNYYENGDEYFYNGEECHYYFVQEEPVANLPEYRFPVKVKIIDTTPFPTLRKASIKLTFTPAADDKYFEIVDPAIHGESYSVSGNTVTIETALGEDIDSIIYWKAQFPNDVKVEWEEVEVPKTSTGDLEYIVGYTYDLNKLPPVSLLEEGNVGSNIITAFEKKGSCYAREFKKLEYSSTYKRYFATYDDQGLTVYNIEREPTTKDITLHCYSTKDNDPTQFTYTVTMTGASDPSARFKDPQGGDLYTLSADGKTAYVTMTSGDQTTFTVPADAILKIEQDEAPGYTTGHAKIDENSYLLEDIIPGYVRMAYSAGHVAFVNTQWDYFIFTKKVDSPYPEKHADVSFFFTLDYSAANYVPGVAGLHANNHNIFGFGNPPDGSGYYVLSDSVIAFFLKDGESISLPLPYYGARFKLLEAPASKDGIDYFPTYTYWYDGLGEESLIDPDIGTSGYGIDWSAPKLLSGGKSFVTCTNTYGNSQFTIYPSELIIRKVTDDPDDQTVFPFKVTLRDGQNKQLRFGVKGALAADSVDYQLNADRTEATFELKNGEQVVLQKVPRSFEVKIGGAFIDTLNAYALIEELEHDGYSIVRMEGIDPTLDPTSKGPAAYELEMVNDPERIVVYNTNPSTGTTNLRVKKLVADDAEGNIDTTTPFPFTVRFVDPNTGNQLTVPAQGTPTPGSEPYTVNADGTVSFSLRHEEWVDIRGVPIGAQANIVENAPDYGIAVHDSIWPDDWWVSAVNGAYSLRLTAQPDREVIYRNAKGAWVPGQGGGNTVTITKNVAPNQEGVIDTETRFPFTVYILDPVSNPCLSSTPSSFPNGSVYYTVDTTKPGNPITFELKHNEKAIFPDLPPGAVVRITEGKVPGKYYFTSYQSSTIRRSNTSSSSAFMPIGAAGGGISTFGAVIGGPTTTLPEPDYEVEIFDNTLVQVTNALREPTTLTIDKNLLPDSTGVIDNDKVFNYRVELFDPDGFWGQPLAYVKPDPATIPADSVPYTVDANGIVTFQLKHGQKAILTGIPMGAGYRVTELDLGYDMTVTDSAGTHTEINNNWRQTKFGLPWQTINKGQWEGTIASAAGETVTYNNIPRELIIVKKVSPTSDPTPFEFEVELDYNGVVLPSEAGGLGGGDFGPMFPGGMKAFGGYSLPSGENASAAAAGDESASVNASAPSAAGQAASPVLQPLANPQGPPAPPALPGGGGAGQLAAFPNITQPTAFMAGSQPFTVSADGTLVSDIRLTHDQKVIIPSIPAGTLVTITELNHDGYTVVIKKEDGTVIDPINNDPGKCQFYMPEPDVDADGNLKPTRLTIFYHNGKTPVLPNSGGEGILTYVLGGLAFALAASILLIIRRRRSNERRLIDVW